MADEVAADPHAEAQPIELISQNEALQRERSGGFLANGQRAPEVAAVDMKSPPPGGGKAPIPKQPAAKSQSAAPTDPNADPDDAYWGGPVHAEEPKSSQKTSKAPKAAEVDVDDEFWGGPAPGPVEKPAPPGKGPIGPSFMDKAMTRVGAGMERLGAGVEEAHGSSVYEDARKKFWQALILPDAVRQNQKDGTTLTEDPLVVQTAKHLKIRPDVFARDWPDYVNMPDADRQRFMDAQSKEIARGGDLISSGMQRRQMAGSVEQNFAPDTAGAPVQNFALNLASVAPDLIGGLGLAMVPAGQIPAAALLTTDFGLRGYSHGRDAGLSDGDAKVYGALTGAANLVPEMPVISALGKTPGASAVLETAFGKTLANSAAGKVGGMAINQGAAGAVQSALQIAVDKGMLDQNMPLSDAIEEIAKGFLTGTVVGAATGAVHAGTNRLVHGPSDPLSTVTSEAAPIQDMPHQAVERPQNIMEHAQQVAMAEEAAKGGDALSQVGAAAYVNAHLSAHHDAAAYEAHMETQHQRVTEENAIADQQAEQQAREDALNQAANAKAPETTPEQAFETQAKTLQERKDADYAKAKNQQGDQEIARGETLEAGAEKGGEGFEKPKLLDTLTPEQSEAFKTLAERRKEEPAPEPTVAERLKAQEPDDNFLPYTEPKVAREPVDEGESWKTPTGATVEVLKDHGDGQYAIRTTPKDSSQLPIRRKVSESALNVMREAAEPAEAPQNLQDRRATVGGNPDVPLADHVIQLHAGPEEAAAARARDAAAVDAAAHEAATSPKSEEPMPSEAQQNAGNFRMGKIEVQGLPISVEHPEGATRPNGVTQGAHYGYIRGTMAADGMHVDVLVGKHPENDTHFVVDHLNKNGEYEQPKVLTAFANRLEAMRAYRKAYPDNPMGPVTEMKTPELKERLAGDMTKPVDQKGVNRLADSRFADTTGRFRPEDVTHHIDGNEHTFSSPNGITMADRQPNGNLRVVSSDTTGGMRGRGEGGARLEAAAQHAHSTGSKLESANQVSEPEQRRYEALRDQGYDVKTNPHRTDPGTGEKFATSELKPVYEVGPKSEPMRARDQSFEAPHGRDASDADRRLVPRMTRDQVVTALKPLTDKIGSENLVVHDNKATLPDDVKAEMVLYNHRNPRGVYHVPTDTVHIVADAHRSIDDVMRTTVHENMHRSIRTTFKSVKEFTDAMKDIYDNISDRAGAIGSPIKGVNKVSAKQWMKDYMSQHGLDARNTSHQELAVDEYIAHLAEHDVNDPKQENPALLRRAMDGVRAALRKVGFVREWTDNDIRALIRKSNANLAAENAGIRESAQLKGSGSRFADEEDHEVERLPPDHPLSVAHKFGMTMEAQANYNRGYVASRRDAVKNTKANSVDHFLGLISLHNIPDSAPEGMPSARAFSRMVQRMAGRRGELAGEKAPTQRAWEQWAQKNPTEDASLRAIMGKSTLGGTDPSKPFESRYSADAMEKDPTKAAHDRMQRSLHSDLKREFAALSDKGRELYNTVRDHYTSDRDATQAGIEQRISELNTDDNTKRQLLDVLRKQFESGRVQGPYFPLARFGNRWASAKFPDGSLFSVSHFDTKAQQRAWMDQRKAEGFTDDMLDGGQKTNNAALVEKIDPKFVARITELVKGSDPSLADDIWQEYLKALPNMSMRKNYIHRQGILGFTNDHLRAFNYNSAHNAHQIARLEYTHRLDGVMDNMDAERRAIEKQNPTSTDSDWANGIHREMQRRYDWVRNPKGNVLSAALTKFGAGWYLGWSPATAFRIFSQQPMIALPTLGGQHGYLRATRELTGAMKQWLTTKGPLGDSLRGDERRAFDEASNNGTFTQHYVQMLMQGGEGKPVYTGKVNAYMRASMFIFNGMESLNRQTTFLAGYRLARKQGLDHDSAIAHGVDMSRLSHFDYSNENRPRILQSNTAKVIGLFKSYAGGVTYRLAREFHEATTLEEQDPGERMKHFKTFAGLMAGTMMYAGVTGVPFSWLAYYAMDKAFGDKDRPFDSKAAMHQWLTDRMGHKTADAITTGPLGAMSEASLSGGASYSDLWYRPPSKDMSPGEQMSDLMGQTLGAVPAIATNAATGYQMMGDDHIERGLEHFVPPAFAGPMKAWRYAHEGVTNLQGEPIISKDELTGWEIALQALDFTPQRVRDASEWKTTRTNLEKEITDRKKLLMNRFDSAVRNGDPAAVTEASENLTAFAQKNPGISRDLPKSMVGSVITKAKKSATSVAGANLNPGLRDLDTTYGASPFEEAKE